jgi:hypothetical protein
MFIRLLCILLPLVFINVSYAVELPPNKSWSWTHHNKMREQARLKALLTKQINEAGSSKTISAIVETTPTASKVGSSMFKRVAYVAKTPGVQMIGVLAVTQLIEGIGWVMKDGTYVKQVSDKQPFECSVDNSTYGDCNTILSESARTTITLTQTQINTYTTFVTNNPTSTASYNSIYLKCAPIDNYYCNSDGYAVQSFKVRAAKAEPRDIPLTPALLGAAMLGSGYSDPDPNFDNTTVNNDQWTGVPEAYTPDSSGIGNELAEELDAKADAAPQTSDGSASSLTDSKYSSDLSTNPDANDRSWQSGDGTKGSTTNTTTTDTETNTTTSSGSFNLPSFCDWAASVCEWYDDWKKSDQAYKEHMTEEKSFWEKVKEWFDWSKSEDGLPNKDDSELIVEPQFEEKKVDINWSAQCPAPQYETVSLHGYTAQVKVQDFSFLCSLDWLLKPFTIGFASILSIFIIFGFQRGTE